MLLFLTNTCRMGCSHCDNDSKPISAHMTNDTLNALKRFIPYIQPFFITISGGEFTEHPYFKDFILEIFRIAKDLEVPAKVILLSNGMFMFDSCKIKDIKELLANDSCLGLQIITGEKFYPLFNSINGMKIDILNLNPKVQVFPERYDLIPKGRALINFPEIVSDCKKKPQCINLYLLTRQSFYSLKEMVQLMQVKSRYNMCKPAVDMYGNVLAGETLSCKKIGNIFNNYDEIFRTLRFSKPCNRCGLMKNVPIYIRKLLDT